MSYGAAYNPVMYQMGGTVFFGGQTGMAPPQRGPFQYVQTGAQGNMMLVNPKAAKKGAQDQPFMYEKGGTVFFDTKKQKKVLKDSGSPQRQIAAGGGEGDGEGKGKAKMHMDQTVEIFDEDGGRCSLSATGGVITLNLGKKAPQPNKRTIKDIRCYDDASHVHFVCNGAPGWHVTLREGDYHDTKRELLAFKRKCGFG